MAFADADDRDVTIARAVDVVRRQTQRRVPVAVAVGVAAEYVHGTDRRRERRKHRILHRDVDYDSRPRAFSLEQRGDDRTIQMDASQKVAQRRTGLQRRTIAVA